MESNLSISPQDIHQTLVSNQISEINLKDGTILKVSNNFGPLKKKKWIRREKDKNENVQQNCKEAHNHYRDGMGAFGQHFKTEYSQICPDCTEGFGIIKRRQNYVLYVSKNVTDGDISKKHKNTNVCQVPQQVQVQQKNQISQNYTKISYNQQQGNKVISQGYAECDYVPIPEPKPKLRKELNRYQKNVNICPECAEGGKVQNVNQQQAQVGDNLCPDCYNEEQEEKITTTVKVLVPDENAL